VAVRFSDAATHDARARLLGERLAEQRLHLNISQSDAAGRAGVSRDAVQRAERGRGTVDTFLRLLAAYGIADHLELLLPEPQVSPAQLLAAERVRARRRARRRPATAADESPPVWGDGA
jgi:transcriptional regulator with XRE-family HTH domain